MVLMAPSLKYMTGRLPTITKTSLNNETTCLETNLFVSTSAQLQIAHTTSKFGIFDYEYVCVCVCSRARSLA